MRFLAHRVGDSNALRLIRRCLEAGVMEDGAVQACEEGTPQGGLISPLREGNVGEPRRVLY
jgi:RNA-directed DNA polymerase